MPYATLPERALLAVNGEEPLAFLQGLVSNDVLRLRNGGIVYTAMLTPQGKFLHDFFVAARGEGLWIDCDKARLPDLHKRLLLYRLRSKVTMEAMPGSFGVAALWDVAEPPAAPDGIMLFRDPRLPELGWRIYGDRGHMEQWRQSRGFQAASADSYDQYRLVLGVPVGGVDLIPEKSFLLPFGFEDLHGVDFNKGCYVGQEVTARSKHLGQMRKFIYKVQSSGPPLPAAGTPVYLGDTLAGELHSVRGTNGLAVIAVEEVAKALNINSNFMCAGQPVMVTLPEWVKNIPATKA